MIVAMPAGLDGNQDPIVTPQRSAVLDDVASEIIQRRVDQTPLVVGVDGIDGAGKSTFADELAALLEAGGQLPNGGV
jgi:uridine kinase